MTPNLNNLEKTVSIQEIRTALSGWRFVDEFSQLLEITDYDVFQLEKNDFLSEKILSFMADEGVKLCVLETTDPQKNKLLQTIQIRLREAYNKKDTDVIAELKPVYKEMARDYYHYDLQKGTDITAPIKTILQDLLKEVD
ncbi:hypothetical protein HOH87_01335 [bacterium]|jgi:hypothetical protein|nr:hypothetical protein [bacterium]